MIEYEIRPGANFSAAIVKLYRIKIRAIAAGTWPGSADAAEAGAQGLAALGDPASSAASAGPDPSHPSIPQKPAPVTLERIAHA